MWSVYLRNKVLDKVLRGSDFTTPAYLSAHTADPGATGANEVTGGGYTRVLLEPSQWQAASAAAAASNRAVAFTSMPTAAVTHWGVWDAVSGGNFLFGGPLSDTVNTTSGEGFGLESGATLTLEAGSS